MLAFSKICQFGHSFKDLNVVVYRSKLPLVLGRVALLAAGVSTYPMGWGGDGVVE